MPGDEFWVCPQCKSLNRANAKKCYSCHWKLGSKLTTPPANSGQSIAPSHGAERQQPAPQQRPGPSGWGGTAPGAVAPGAVAPGAVAPGGAPAGWGAAPGSAGVGSGVSVATAVAAPERHGIHVPLPRLRRSSPPAVDPGLPPTFGGGTKPSPAYSPQASYASPGTYRDPAAGMPMQAPVYTAAEWDARTTAESAATADRSRLPHPAAPRFVRALDVRPAFAPRGAYYSVRRLGYATGALMVVLLVTAVAQVPTGARLVQAALEDGSLRRANSILDASTLGIVEPLVIAMVAVGLLTLLLFSIVLAVSTHNAPGVGTDLPLQMPIAAAASWWNLAWAHGRMAVALLAPVYLFSTGLGIVGGVIAILALERLQRNVPDVTGWLTRPARHLADLYDKLALKGTSSLLAKTWKFCFYLANLLVIAALAMPLAVAVAGQVGVIAGNLRIGAASSSVLLSYSRIAVLSVVAAAVVASLVALTLLIPMTIDLVRRQHTRRFLVVAGLARPWVQPGEQPQAALGAGEAGDLDELGWAVETREPLPEDAVKVPAWRQREVSQEAGPVTFADWIGRLKADQIREDQARIAAEAATEEEDASDSTGESGASATATAGAPDEVRQEGDDVAEALARQREPAGEAAAAPASRRPDPEPAVTDDREAGTEDAPGPEPQPTSHTNDALTNPARLRALGRRPGAKRSTEPQEPPPPQEPPTPQEAQPPEDGDAAT